MHISPYNLPLLLFLHYIPLFKGHKAFNLEGEWLVLLVRTNSDVFEISGSDEIPIEGEAKLTVFFSELLMDFTKNDIFMHPVQES